MLNGHEILLGLVVNLQKTRFKNNLIVISRFLELDRFCRIMRN